MELGSIAQRACRAVLRTISFVPFVGSTGASALVGKAVATWEAINSRSFLDHKNRYFPKARETVFHERLSAALLLCCALYG